LAGRIGTAALWIVATPFVLSRLGPERFGVWSLFFAFNGYLLALDLGVGNTMIRFIAAQRPAHDRCALLRTLRRGLWAAFGLGLAWTMVVLLARGWVVTAFHVPPAMSGEVRDALVIFAISVLFLFPVQAMMASLTGFERVDLTNACMFAGVATNVLVLWVSLSAGAGVRGAAFAGLVAQIVAGAFAGAALAKELRAVAAGGDAPGPSWREMLHFGAALQLLWILIMLQIQSARFVLGMLGNLTMVAEYELAFRVAVAIAGLPILIRDPIIPAVTRTLGSDGPGAVVSLYESASRWLYLNSAMVLGLLWLLASDLVRVWLGPGHEAIADLIHLWVLAHAANLVYAPGVAIARGMGRPGYEIASYAAALATNIGLCILWIPQHGTRGAVSAVAVSYCVGAIVFIAGFHRRSVFAPFWSSLGRGLLLRGLAGTAAAGLSAALLASPPVASLLPSPGWLHGVAVVVVFLTLFGLAFHPLGDTRRLLQTLGQMMTAALPRRRTSPS
jgi:O-antigen/teichoic acid export membrane protein